MPYLTNIIIKLTKPVLLLLVVQVFLFGSCNKNSTHPCLNGGYAFNATSEWAVQQDVYHVGDTIILSSTIPKTLTDQVNTSLVVDYSNSVGISGDMPIYILDSMLKQVVPARDSFTLITKTGFFSERKFNTNAGINFSFQENSQNYLFQGGVLCKRKGTYVIYISDLLSNGLRGKDCTNANFGMTVTNTDKHVSLWQNALQIIPDDLHKKGMYCFRVQ